GLQPRAERGAGAGRQRGAAAGAARGGAGLRPPGDRRGRTLGDGPAGRPSAVPGASAAGAGRGRARRTAMIEIKWTDTDPETGARRFLCAERFARAWRFKWKLQRRGEWTRGLEP